MRRITTPAPEAPAVEDVKISFFDFDNNGNVAVKESLIEVPTGFGRFAQAAMIKGFLEFFDKEMPTHEPNDPKLQLQKNAIDKSLASLKKLIADIEARQTQPEQPVQQ